MTRKKTPSLTGLFVTGTSTDAGKTVVAVLLCRILAASGVRTAYFKPVQTGCVLRHGLREAPDLRFVADSLSDFSGFRSGAGMMLKTPAAPVLAARLEKKKISFDAILSSVRRFGRMGEALICEGAGGLAVPLEESGRDMADLARALGFPLVLCGPAGLGALNHFFLTASFARAKGLRIAACFLLCDASRASLIERDNLSVLRKKYPDTEMVLLPRVAGLDRGPTRRKALSVLAGRLTGNLNRSVGEGWIRG